MPATVSSSRRPIDGRWIGTVARLVIGGVFAVSGYTKIVDIDGTIRSVRAYKLLPEAVVPAIGAGLPVLELALSLLLLTGLLIRAAAVVTIPLCAAFFYGVSWAWAKGLTIECGCFGNGGLTPHPVPGYIRELVINAVLISAAAWLVRRPASFASLDSALGLSAAGLETGDDEDETRDDGDDENRDDADRDDDSDRDDMIGAPK